MKNVALIVISICLLNVTLSAEDKTLNDILEKHKDKEAISEIASLLNEGINAQDDNGSTALMIASEYGYTEIVMSLINAEAEFNILDNNGNTALSLASQNGYTEIVELLEAAGAKE